MSIMQKLIKELKLTFRINLVILKKAIDRPVQTVASAKRSVKPGRKTVRLTSSQVAIAKKLGVPLEEYAKQLKNTEGA